MMLIFERGLLEQFIFISGQSFSVTWSEEKAGLLRKSKTASLRSFRNLQRWTLIKFEDETELRSCTSKYVVMVSLLLDLEILNDRYGSNCSGNAYLPNEHVE